MIAYGLIDRDANPTELGRQLYELRNDESILHAEFARHILLNLNGMNLVQCIQDIQAAGEVVDLIKLREWLAERGIHFPRGGKHPSRMRSGWKRLAFSPAVGAWTRPGFAKVNMFNPYPPDSGKNLPGHQSESAGRVNA